MRRTRAAGSRALQEQEDAVARATALGGDLVAAIREKRAYPEQDEERSGLFSLMKNLVYAMREGYPAQYEHWVKRGWL